MFILELYIPPNKKYKTEIIKYNFKKLYKYKNYLNKFKIYLYSTDDIDFEYNQRIKYKFVKISENINNLKSLWQEYFDNYNVRDNEWIVHFDMTNKLIEFDFIKLSHKKCLNMFIKKNNTNVYEKLFLININLLIEFVFSSYIDMSLDFLNKNTDKIIYLKYMNILVEKNGVNYYL